METCTAAAPESDLEPPQEKEPAPHGNGCVSAVNTPNCPTALMSGPSIGPATSSFRRPSVAAVGRRLPRRNP